MTKLILQRRLTGDARKWRSVCRFHPTDEDVAKVEQAVSILSGIDQIEWRIVTDNTSQTMLSYHDGKAWVKTE